MNGKRLLLALAVVLAVSLLAVACGGDEEAVTTTAAPAPDAAAASTTAPETTAPAQTTAAAETINLAFSCHLPPQAAYSGGLKAYAAYIEDNSNGRVKIDLHIGGELYSNQEIFDGLRTQGADAGTYIVDSADGFYYNTIFSLPFIRFAGEKHATAAYWTLFDEFPELEQEFLDLGLAKGTHFSLPPVHIHWHQPDLVVTTPADLKGKSLLTLEAYVADWFSVLGASTEQPAMPDLFPMINSKAADGIVQTFGFLGGYDLVKDFQSHTMFGESGVLMVNIGVAWNRDTWESLPDDIKQIAVDGRSVYVETSYGLARKDVEGYIAQAEEANHTMTVLTPEQIQPWRELLQPSYQKWIDGAPDPAVAQRMFDRLMELTQ